MAVTCTFPLGEVAIFSDGQWSGANAELLKALTSCMAHLSPTHRPWPERDIASEAAAQLGGKVTAADPPPAQPTATGDMQF